MVKSKKSPSNFGRGGIGMKWEDYHKMYWVYELSVNQSKVLNFFGQEIFKEFPKGLPDDIKGQWENNRKFLLEMLVQITNEPINENSENLESKMKDIEPGNLDIFMNQLAIYNSSIHLGLKTPEDINFQRLFFSQELIMACAHLEAFLSDSLRVICRVRPEILKSGKKIDRSTIIDSGNWDKVIECIIEDYIYEFGWKTLKDKIKFLKDKIGLNVEIPNSELSILEEAENIRNIVVHNGGRISQEYINRTEKSDLNVGDLIPITAEFMGKVSYISLLLGWDIFALVSKKFFDIDGSKLIWRKRNSSP